MNAKQAFQEIEYVQVRADDDYIIYEKKIPGENNEKVVTFCDQLRSFTVSFERTLDTAHIDMELFKAITLQLEELGWTA